MMPTNRYAVIAALGLPVLLLALSMLARTELVIGDRVRAAIEARASRAGADVEVLTVEPDGLLGIELKRVSARVPRGEFAIELDVESIVITPTFGSLFGEVEITDIAVNHGVVAIVPWSAPPKPKAAPRVDAPPSKPAARKRASTARPIDIALNRLQIVALNDAYRTIPLELTRAEFVWTAGKPIAALAGYGTLPDGVAFSIGAFDDADHKVYRLQPQRRTAIDAWVAPIGGVHWPVSMLVRDVKLCPTCEDVVALEDVEIAVPAWRDDVRITAPEASVSRRGSELSLGAPEMAILDTATREFAARITESAFSYTLDTGHLNGRLELAAADGGSLGATWSWDARDFVVKFRADDFPLPAIWHLSPIGDRIQPGRMDGTAQVGWDMQRRTLRLQSDLRLGHLTLRVPFTDEVIDVASGRFEVDVFFDAPGRALSVRRAALSLGDAPPIEGAFTLVDANVGFAFDGSVRLVEQDAARLLATLPDQWTAVARGADFGGTFGFEIHAAGHSAYPESLVLEGALLGEVDVRSEGAADVGAIGRSGPPPMHAFKEWTSLSAIGEPTWQVVLAAEDAKFMQHDGFDWRGLQRAMVHNLRANRPARGGSTISQQVAKNLFLSGSRTLARKLQEAYLTWRLESRVPKLRILEIYLNIAQWGGSITGLGAAAQHYFGVAPHRLAYVEVAMLAAILPNPHRFGGWIDDGRIATSRLEKLERILRNLKFLKKISGEQYRSWWAAAQRGEIGRLRLTPCDDLGRGDSPKCARD